MVSTCLWWTGDWGKTPKQRTFWCFPFRILPPYPGYSCLFTSLLKKSWLMVLLLLICLWTSLEFQNILSKNTVCSVCIFAWLSIWLFHWLHLFACPSTIQSSVIQCRVFTALKKMKPLKKHQMFLINWYAVNMCCEIELGQSWSGAFSWIRAESGYEAFSEGDPASGPYLGQIWGF